jgi:UDP-N-acetylmuramoylalanine--D-glutamate ligase
MTGVEAVGTDVVARGRTYLASLAGRRVTVVGLARSGVAAARLLVRAGARVTAADAKPLDALGAEVPALAPLGVRVVAGAVPATVFADAGLVVVSPGVPVDAPDLAPARAAGIPLIGELELGWRATEAEAVAITGTNGKTTTTALTGALLAAGPRPVLVAGNIGTPLAAHALELPATAVAVLEVSSFQLETVAAFRPRVAAVLNVTPDHLDRHRTLEAYVNAKARIFENQTADDRAVLNADDPLARRLGAGIRAQVVPFSRRQPLERGVSVQDDMIVAAVDGERRTVCPVAAISLRGAHNVENVLAAVACALAAGAPPESLEGAIRAFRAVAHRIEPVRHLDGVAYVNDSKGTNVESTVKALESFTERVVLIAGGQGKGQDFRPLAGAARGRVSHALLIGVDGPAVAAALEAAGVPATPCPSLAAAVEAARRLAVPGDVVLLSPACASFDMFASFEHRGDTFRRLVQDLPCRAS